MSKILTFTGLSGSGKTTIAKALIERLLVDTRMVTSYTTRQRRPTDIQGEYEYLSEQEFDALGSEPPYLWTASHAGVRYGTMAAPIKAVLEKRDTIGIMILVPEAVQKLRDYLASVGTMSAHVPVFILSPRRETLLRRMRERGDAVQDAQRRLAAETGWGEQALASTIPFEFIENDGDIDDAIQEVTEIVS